MSGITKKVEHAATPSDLKVMVESALKDAIADPTMADMTLDRGAVAMLVEMIGEPAALLDRVKSHVTGYYAALDHRKHGDLAMYKAFDAIQLELDMHWVQGATLKTEE